LLVQAGIKQQLTEALEQEIIRVYGVDPETSEDYPRIINERNLKRLATMLEGVNIVFGGKVNEDDCYLSPTLIDEPDLDSLVMKGEIFGPILPILVYKNRSDINKVITTYEKPLSFYVFSNNRNFVKQILTSYSFGGGAVNDTLIQFGNHRLPFGGVGDSGMGAYHGRLGFDTFSHQKAIVKKGNWLDIPIRYAPYKGKLKQLKALFKFFS